MLPKEYSSDLGFFWGLILGRRLATVTLNAQDIPSSSYDHDSTLTAPVNASPRVLAVCSLIHKCIAPS